jgi:hypothetical protein
MEVQSGRRTEGLRFTASVQSQVAHDLRATFPAALPSQGALSAAIGGATTKCPVEVGQKIRATCADWEPNDATL